MILLAWCWGFNCFIWNKYEINYILIFKLDVDLHYTYIQTFKHCIDLTIIYFSNFLLFLKMMNGAVDEFIPFTYIPMFLYLSFIIYILYYIRPLKSSATYPFAIALYEIIISPFSQVSFLASYIADVLTSLVKVYFDLWYGLCWTFGNYWSSSNYNDLQQAVQQCTKSSFALNILAPLFSSLPLWWRLMQNLRIYFDTRARFPSLANAGKYAVSAIVVIFGVMHTEQVNKPGVHFEWSMYLLSLIVSTSYAFTWDITMDWSLMKKQFKYLRRRLMFPTFWYYFAIIIDLILRFAWTFTLIPVGRGTPLSANVMLYVTPCLASAEILRRTMWACFRLENEHLTKTKQYSKLEFIPLHFDQKIHTNTSYTSHVSGTRVILELAAIIFSVTVLAFVASMK